MSQNQGNTLFAAVSGLSSFCGFLHIEIRLISANVSPTETKSSIINVKYFFYEEILIPFTNVSAVCAKRCC